MVKPLYSLYHGAARARKTVERMEKDNCQQAAIPKATGMQPELDAPASAPRVPYIFPPRPRSNFSSLIPDSHYCPPATRPTYVRYHSRRSLPQVPDRGSPLAGAHAMRSETARACFSLPGARHLFPLLLPFCSPFPSSSCVEFETLMYAGAGGG